VNTMLAKTDNTVELQRQAVQAAIDSSNSATDRNRLGQFATPPHLAIDIARFVGSHIGSGGIHFADPAVGSGSFYSAAIAVFGSERIKSAIGVEIDVTFADAARKLWSDVGLEVLHGDFTRVVANGARPKAPNLILANPPYVRHHHINRCEKERLKELVFRLTGVEMNGLAGLYCYFLLLATSWLENDGYAAWLIPSEFMDVNYGASIKRFLTNCVTLIRVHRFDPDEVQFGDALVSSAVLVLKKTPPSSDHKIEFTFGGSLSEPQARDRISLDQLRESRKWTIYPSHTKNDRHTISDGHGPTLADFFKVQRGIATGDNKFFILERAEAQRRALPKKYLRPILPSPRFLKTTIIEPDDEGFPLIEQQLCVIDCDLPEHVVERQHPALWEYLQTAEALGVKNGYLVGKRSPWYKQERREPSPFLCTYMGRGSADKQPFRFIWNRSLAIGSNLYLMLYPLKCLKSMLVRHPERYKAVHKLLGEVTGYELRGEGRVYGGGLNKIEPSELGRISVLPFVDLWPELLFETAKQGSLFG